MLLVSAGDPRVQSVLSRCADVVAKRGAFIVLVEQAPVLEDRYDLVDECVDSVFVGVNRDPEPVDRSGLKPFLHVVGGDTGRADRSGVVVDDAMSQDLPYGPSLVSDLQGPAVVNAA